MPSQTPPQVRFTTRAPALLLAGLIGAGLAGCADPDTKAPGDNPTPPTGLTDDTATSPPDSGANVIRLGPPAPTVGIYGIAADPSYVYVANLHVPFITLASPQTGAWIGAIDLRDAGISAAFFPRLFLFGDRLWITQQNEDRLVRLVVPEGSLDGEITVDDHFGGLTADDTTLYVSLRRGTIVGYDGETGTRVLTLDAPEGTAIAVEADHFAVLGPPTQPAAYLLNREGDLLWEAELSEFASLNDVAVLDGRVFVTDRISGSVVALEDGREVGRIHTGSDTFALYRRGEVIYVTNRQGAALSAAGAYDGTPARVTAIDRDLNVLWTVDLAKTIHFLASDGDRLWAANEDSLQLSAIDPTTRTETLRGPRLGLTIDALTAADECIFFGSHLTDEVWAVNRGGEAEGIGVCGWPFVAVPIGGSLGVPCQESGDVATVSTDPLRLTETDDIATTFHVTCPDGLCTGHKQFLSAADDGGTLVWTEPATASLRWADGRSLVLRDSVEFAAKVQHFDVAALDGGLVVYEPIDQRLIRVVGGAATGSVSVPGVEVAFPLVIDGDRVWVGQTAFDSALNEVGSVGGGAAVAASEGVVVTQDTDALIAWVDGVEAGRVALDDLSVPPWVSLSGDYGPLRFRAVGHDLFIANTFRGTLERRRLPGLGPLGEGTVLAGTWAELDGIW